MEPWRSVAFFISLCKYGRNISIRDKTLHDIFNFADGHDARFFLSLPGFMITDHRKLSKFNRTLSDTTA